MSERIFLSPPWMTGDEERMVAEAFASRYIAPCGPMGDRFERVFAETGRQPCAAAVASGTAALALLFRDLGVEKGDTVFCSDLTFISSVGPACHMGAEPVFIDSGLETWTMDPGLLEEALRDAARASRLPKAVVAVDLYGQCCDYDRLAPLCARYGVPLVIDAAEALGARYKGRPAGTAGYAAVFSFNGNKIVTTSGGGMVVSADAGVVARARKRSQQSREPEAWYEHREVGFNYRMSNLLAAVGLGQLLHLPEILERKRRIFETYLERMPAETGVTFMPAASYGEPSRWLTVALLPDAAAGEPGRPSRRVLDAVRTLDEAGIEARPVWKPMHLQPVFSGCRCYGGGVGEKLFSSGICLPSGTALRREDVERISDLLQTGKRE